MTMRLLLARIFVLVIAHFCLAVPKESSASTITPDEIATASASSQWRLLLQYPDNADASDLGPAFFFSDNGAFNPTDEMAALIAALESGADEVQCRFPARILWLSRRFNRPEWSNADCTSLREWARIDEIEAISLVLVSGYLGNPASSFGHSLMKIRYKGEHQRSHLMGLGINYGANVPDNEPMIKYILNGLFGGYEAAFSDSTFYAHDQTYARSEFRDLWEYPLKLDDYQTRLIVYSLWELRDQRFKYYFLTKNCGYRLAQLVEMAVGQPLTADVGGWYLPVDLFVDLDPAAFAEPVFHPSSQRELLNRMRALSPMARDTAKAIMSAQLSRVAAESSFEPFDQLDKPDDQHAVLDTLLAFYEFQDVANRDDATTSPWAPYRQQVLAKRYRLPVSSYDTGTPLNRLSAKDTDRPASVQLSTGQTQDVTYGLLGYTAVANDGNSYTDLIGSELQILKLEAGHYEDGAFLQQLILADVTRLQDISQNLPGYRPISWTAAAGWRPDTEGCIDCASFFAKGGLGLAASLSDHWLASVFGLTTYQRSLNSVVGEVEFKVASHSIAAYSLGFGTRYGSKSVEERDYALAFIEGRWSIAPNLHLKTEASSYWAGNLPGKFQIGIEHRF